MGEKLARPTHSHQRMELGGQGRDNVYPAFPANNRVPLAGGTHGTRNGARSGGRSDDNLRHLYKAGRGRVSDPNSCWQEDGEREVQRCCVHDDNGGYDARRQSITDGNLTPPWTKVLNTFRNQVPGEG